MAKANEKAREFVKELFRHVPVLDSGARGSTMTFVQRDMGDVLAGLGERGVPVDQGVGAGQVRDRRSLGQHSGRAAGGGRGQDVDKHGTREVAEAYLKYLYSPEGQTIAAKHYYRPRNAEVGAATSMLKQFPKVELFTIDDVFGGWEKAQPEHLRRRRFDQIHKRQIVASPVGWQFIATPTADAANGHA